MSMPAKSWLFVKYCLLYKSLKLFFKMDERESSFLFGLDICDIKMSIFDFNEEVDEMIVLSIFFNL